MQPHNDKHVVSGTVKSLMLDDHISEYCKLPQIHFKFCTPSQKRKLYTAGHKFQSEIPTHKVRLLSLAVHTHHCRAYLLSAEVLSWNTGAEATLAKGLDVVQEVVPML